MCVAALALTFLTAIPAATALALLPDSSEVGLPLEMLFMLCVIPFVMTVLCVDIPLLFPVFEHVVLGDRSKRASKSIDTIADEREK